MRRGNEAGFVAASRPVAINPVGAPDIAGSLLGSETAFEDALRSLPRRRAPRDLVDRIMARVESETDHSVR